MYSPDHAYLAIPLSSVPADVCECNATSACSDHRKREAIQLWTKSRRAGRPLVVKFHHETYDAVDWVLRGVRKDASPALVILAVRPRKARLRSMFTDYWTQVAIAEGTLADDGPSTPHRLNQLAKYSADAVHYRDAAGSIDGVAWFSSFKRYGAGLPFFLDEVFGGDVGRLEREVRTGPLRLVTTAQVGAFLEEFTGRPIAVSRRVSRTAHDPAIVAALDDAVHIIDELAERDASFDRFIADYLGEPDFYVD